MTNMDPLVAAVAVAAAPAVVVAELAVRYLGQGMCKFRLCHASNTTVEELQYVERLSYAYDIPGMAIPSRL